MAVVYGKCGLGPPPDWSRTRFVQLVPGTTYAGYWRDTILVKATAARIERDVQFNHVHPRVTEKSPLSALGVLANKACDFLLRNLAFCRDAANLELGRRWRDIRVKSRCRCRNQVHGDGHAGILGLQFGHGSVDAGDQLRVGRAQVRTAGGAGIVACGACRRWPGVKIARP